MQDKVSWTLNMTKNQSSLHIENKFQRPDLPLLGIEPRSSGSQIQHFINGTRGKSHKITLVPVCPNHIMFCLICTVCFGRAPH